MDARNSVLDFENIILGRIVTLERQLVMTGIGGQGVQLAAELLARAAVACDRHVSLFGGYGGMMRGGNTEATIVVSDQPVLGPPTVDAAWSLIVMSLKFWSMVSDKVRSDSYLVVDSTVVTLPIEHDPALVLGVPAKAIALSLHNAAVSTMVALGAYVAATDVVPVEALLDELPNALPPYRLQHVAINEAAIRAGAEQVRKPLHPAWADIVVSR